MAEPSIVTPIKPGKSRRARSFKFPKGVKDVIDEDQWRVREAWAVAQLLSEHLTSPPGRENDDSVAMLVADALARMLQPIDSFNDAAELVRRAERQEAANA